MNTNSPSAERLSLPRNFGIIDTMVLMLAAALFAAWILGTIFLCFFPAGASGSADSQTAALVVGEDGASGDPTDTQSSDDASDPNPSSATGGNSNQIEAGVELASEEKSAFEKKISTLQKQLVTKSQELTQLRKSSTKSANSNSESAVDASKYEKQISLLTKQKDQLDQKIKRLNDQSKTQKTKIESLQDQLDIASKANSMAGATGAENNFAAIDGAPQRNQPLEFRDWISSKGNKARLAFVRWEDGEIVVVNEDNKTFRLTPNRLSPEDQKYVNSKR